MVKCNMNRVLYCFNNNILLIVHKKSKLEVLRLLLVRRGQVQMVKGLH